MMDPNFKLLLDEMSNLNRRFDEHGELWNRRFTDLERSIFERSTSIESRVASVEASASDNAVAFSRRLTALESTPADPSAPAVESRLVSIEANYADRDAEFSKRLFELERLHVAPIQGARDDRVAQLESSLEDVRLHVQKLEKRRDRELFDEMSHGPGILSIPTQAAAHSSAGLTAEPPVVGHRVEMITRDSGSGVVTTWIPIPAKGTYTAPPSPLPRSPVFGPRPPPPQQPPDPHRRVHHPAMIANPPPRPPHHEPQFPNNPTGRLPKVPFPRFDGDNPRRWRTRAEKYFAMYAVDPSLWISVSEMHFDGPAS